MAGVRFGSLDELTCNRGFGGSEDDPCLLLALGLSLPGHGILQRLRDRNYLRITGERIEIPDVLALGQLQVLLGARDELSGASAEATPPADGAESRRA